MPEDAAPADEYRRAAINRLARELFLLDAVPGPGTAEPKKCFESAQRFYAEQDLRDQTPVAEWTDPK